MNPIVLLALVLDEDTPNAFYFDMTCHQTKVLSRDSHPYIGYR